MEIIINFIENLLLSIGIEGSSISVVRHALMVIITFLISGLSGFICRKTLVPLVIKLTSKTSIEWDEILFDRDVLYTACNIVPAVVIWGLLPKVFFQYPFVEDILLRLTAVYIVVNSTRLVLQIVDRLRFLRKEEGSSSSQYIRSFLGVLKIILIFIAVIIVISILFKKNPMSLFAGLGATSAILMLVFKDTIEGLVAGIRLTSNEMVHLGDWITVPGTPADGIVEDVTLTTVKVRNFDNTTATVTPMALVNGSFQNWRSMAAGSGRRVTRQVYFDFKSIGFVSDEQKQALISKELFTEDELKGNHINIALYRQYIERYLSSRKDIIPEMGLLVREVEATQSGLPLCFVFFIKNDPAVHYEHTLAEIVEWCYAMANEFKLTIYQQFPNKNA